MGCVTAGIYFSCKFMPLSEFLCVCASVKSSLVDLAALLKLYFHSKSLNVQCSLKTLAQLDCKLMTVAHLFF